MDKLPDDLISDEMPERPIVLRHNGVQITLTDTEATLLNYALSKETSLGNILRTIGEDYDEEWFRRVLNLLYATMLTSRDEPFDIDTRTAMCVCIIIQDLNDTYPNALLEEFVRKLKTLRMGDYSGQVHS